MAGACACLAPRPLIPPFEFALLRVATAPASEVFGLGRRMPSAPSMSLEPLDASAGGRPGRASSTAKLKSERMKRSRSKGSKFSSSSKL